MIIRDEKQRYEIAHASGHDVANRSMRKAGRTKWSKADYNKAVKEFNRLFPKEEN